ncbi:MAG: S24/S26 family peptidase [Bacteroidales bacterium]|nr:S24/S26 family peptidase [Bacteroidales bacterium]
MIKEYPNSEIFKYVAEEISHGENVQLRVKGNSMLPFIREGDSIILIPYNPSCLKIGDVVLFNHKKEVRLHRIIHKNGSSLILQGDGNINAKELIDLLDVIGKLKQIIRRNEKKINTDTWVWYFSFYIWYLLRPFRSYLLKLYRVCKNN